MLVRTWWSLYSLEQMLSTTTGRPSIVVDSNCSVPLPVPVYDGSLPDYVEMSYKWGSGSKTDGSGPSKVSSVPNVTAEHSTTPTGITTFSTNHGSFFRAACQLSIISKSILTSLYSVETMIKPPEEMHQEVSQLEDRLEKCVVSLPADLNFREPTSISADTFARERMLLAFQFSNAKMLLARPYLTGRRQPWGDAEGAKFAKRMANDCVKTAQITINLLSDEKRFDLIYDQGPWWCIINHLMQAISVLLLGLSFPETISHDSLALIECVKKAIRWLKATDDSTFNRAYHVALNSLQSVARRYSVDTSDLWTMNMMMPAWEELPRGFEMGMFCGLPMLFRSPYG